MPNSLRVLIVEDSEDDTLLLTRELRRGNFDPVYERVDCPEAMSDALDRQTWDLVLADFSMPHFRGDTALAMLRQRGLDIPFIFVSGTIGEEAAVAAMRVGANDYIIKGNFNRLIPAIERDLQEAETRRKRRQAEQALVESNARYRELVENATYGIYCSALETRFLEVNSALVDILGYASKEELLSLDVAGEVYCRPEDRQRVTREVQQSNRFKGLEVQWKRRDGRFIVVRLSGRVLPKTAAGNPWLEVIAEDITERRALQRQITALQKFDAIGRLAGGIAHDFNNVIGAILGWADLGAQEAGADSRFSRYFDIIRDNSHLAADLTRQLLAFARKQPLDPVAVDLNQTVSQAVALLDRTMGSNVKISTHLEAGLGSVLADPTQAQQVVMNLCLNARDAMPTGGELSLETTRIWVNEEYARACPDSKPGIYALLTVSDNGLGMDAATLEKIFEPFFTTKEAGKGNGLGLATE
jgi:PAS domain S-box-containing protein